MGARPGRRGGSNRAATKPAVTDVVGEHEQSVHPRGLIKDRHRRVLVHGVRLGESGGMEHVGDDDALMRGLGVV